MIPSMLRLNDSRQERPLQAVTSAKVLIKRDPCPCEREIYIISSSLVGLRPIVTVQVELVVFLPHLKGPVCGYACRLQNLGTLLCFCRASGRALGHGNLFLCLDEFRRRQ